MSMETIRRLGNVPTLLHVWGKCRHERGVDIVCVWVPAQNILKSVKGKSGERMMRLSCGGDNQKAEKQKCSLTVQELLITVHGCMETHGAHR